MKQKFLLKTMLLLCALVAGTSMSWADTYTIGWGSASGSNSTNFSDVSGTVSGIVSFTTAQNSSSNAPAYNSSSKEIRLYYSSTGDGCSITLTPASGKKITQIVITASSASYTPPINYMVDGGSANNATWSSTTSTISGIEATTSVEIQNVQTSTSKQLRIKTIAITYSDAVPTKVATPEISGNTKFVGSTTVTITCATDGAAIKYTTDDGDSWNDYSTSLTFTETTTVKAKATDPGDELDDSDVSDPVTFTKVTPMTVAEAVDYIDAGVDLDDQFVSGIVSQVDEYNSTYNSITYWISDDGTTTGQMEVYGGKGLDNANFSAITDLEVGDKVTVRGTLKKYLEIYEFGTGSYLMSLVEIEESDLTKTDDISLSMASPETTADATAYFTTSSSGAITYESGNTSIATVSAAGVVTPVAAGSTTITVSQAADANYKAGEITINVTVAAASLYSTTIAANASGSTTYGTPKVEVYMIDGTYDGTIAAVSSNPAVATVDITQHISGEGTFTITPVAVGTAVITISAPATATCEAAENVTYTITVTAPDGGTTAAATSTVLFNETFNKCDGSGGRDDVFTGNIGTSATSGKLDESWATIGSNAASQCIKLGTGSGTGVVTTSDISLTGAGTLTFSAAGWGDDKTNTVTVTATGATLSGDTDVTLTASTWKSYSVNITGATGTVAITFTMKRGFLDDVVVRDAGVDLSVTLNGSGYATYCSEYPLDFTDSEAAGYSAWQITGVSGSTITFSKITGRVKGGTGLFLMGEADATITLTSADSNNELGSNLLIGTLAPTRAEAGQYYGLKGNQFVKVKESTVPAGKAILPVGAVGVKEFLTFSFEDGADGLERVQDVQEVQGAIFNLAGQRLSKMQKGINIVNGKKILY